MEKVKKYYEFVDLVESASFSKIWKGRDKATGKLVAIKQLEKSPHIGYTRKGARFVPWTSVRELSVWKILAREQSPYVVRLLGYFLLPNTSEDKGKDYVFLIMEYMDSNLRKYLRKHSEPVGPKKPIFFGNIKIIMYRICKAIEVLHKQGIMHRDLKPENVLIDSLSFTVKLGGFGSSGDIIDPNIARREDMTLSYQAPEVLLRAQEYSFPADMWAIGCIFAELVTLCPIFPKTTPSDQLKLMFSVLGTPNEQMWPGVTSFLDFKDYCETPFTPGWSKCFNVLGGDGVDLLMKMLCLSPEKRIKVEEAVKHKYFQGRSL